MRTMACSAIPIAIAGSKGRYDVRVELAIAIASYLESRHRQTYLLCTSVRRYVHACSTRIVVDTRSLRKSIQRDGEKNEMRTNLCF